MPIQIQIESSWDSDDGEGRTIEVTVSERTAPWEDPSEDSRWFAGGDLERLKSYLCRLVDRKAERFSGRDRRECRKCGRVVHTNDRTAEFHCRSCHSH